MKKFNVIHAGLEPAPELKEKVNKIISELNQIVGNKKRHLADVGILLSCAAKDLSKLSDEAFKKHAEIRDNLTTGESL